MNHIMIDIETLSLNQGATILSIGAVFFKPKTGELGESFYKVINPRQGRDIDAGTVMWWFQQSGLARAEFISDCGIMLVSALEQLSKFIKSGTTNGIRIWAKGNLDAAVLTDAYQSIPALSNPPWHYRDIMDLRTLREMDGGLTEAVEPIEEHNALSDAVAQALYACAMMQRLEIDL